MFLSFLDIAGHSITQFYSKRKHLNFVLSVDPRELPLQGKRDVALLRFEQKQQRLNETATTNWLKGTVRPDWICMRVVSMKSP